MGRALARSINKLANPITLPTSTQEQRKKKKTRRSDSEDHGQAAMSDNAGADTPTPSRHIKKRTKSQKVLPKDLTWCYLCGRVTT